MRGVFKTLLTSTQKHLGKTRTQLAEATQELLEEKKERKRLQEELDRFTEGEREVYRPVVLPLSPPHSPTSEDINARLNKLRICGEAPTAHILVEGELDEGQYYEYKCLGILLNY